LKPSYIQKGLLIWNSGNQEKIDPLPGSTIKKIKNPVDPDKSG
jgi:hypothetical protein